MSAVLCAVRVFLACVIIAIMYIMCSRSPDFYDKCLVGLKGYCTYIFVFAGASLFAELPLMISSGASQPCLKLFVAVCWVIPYIMTSSRVYFLSSSYMFNVDVEIMLALILALGTIAVLIDSMTEICSLSKATGETSGTDLFVT